MAETCQSGGNPSAQFHALISRSWQCSRWTSASAARLGRVLGCCRPCGNDNSIKDGTRHHWRVLAKAVTVPPDTHRGDNSRVTAMRQLVSGQEDSQAVPDRSDVPP